jgi:hypothetical protein
VGWMNFVSQMTGHVLSWPVAVVLCVVVLKRPLGDLLGRLRAWKGFGQEADFDSKIVAASEDIQDAVRQVEGKEAAEQIEGEPSRAPIPTESPVESAFLWLLASTPSVEVTSGLARGAIVGAWADFERSVGDAIRTWRSGTGREVQGSLSGLKLVLALRESGLVSEKTIKAVTDMRAIRNSAQHGDSEPTADQAQAVIIQLSMLRNLIVRQLGQEP